MLLVDIYFIWLSAGPCPSGTFACDNGTLCVPQRQICDHRRDCVDGSDEHPVECGLLYGSKKLADKIVRNAIEKRRRQHEKHQQSSLASASLDAVYNVTKNSESTPGEFNFTKQNLHNHTHSQHQPELQQATKDNSGRHRNITVICGKYTEKSEPDLIKNELKV